MLHRPFISVQKDVIYEWYEAGCQDLDNIRNTANGDKRRRIDVLECVSAPQVLNSGLLSDHSHHFGLNTPLPRQILPRPLGPGDVRAYSPR